MKNSKFFTLIAIVAIIGIMLSACGQAATPAPEAPAAPAATEAPAAPAATDVPAVSADPSGGTLNLGLGSEPETLDPGDAVYVQEQFVLINLFDSLLSTAPDATLHPGLALSWTPNADYTEFAFKLRQDVKFHDGTPFTAQAVKASFDHIVSADVLESGGKTLLVDHKYTETTIADDFNVTVKFAASYPTFLRDAGRQWLSISSPAALTKYGKDYGRNPVGTGPFKFVKWDAQSQIVLERNPDYNWAPEFAAHKGAAYLDQVVFRILPEAATRLTALQTGELQVVSEPPALDAIDMAGSGQAVVKTFAQPGIPAIMMINTEAEPTNDLNVRKAMILSINQEELAQTAFKTLGLPSYSVLSPTTWSFDEKSASLYRFNLEEAGRLLDESGWKDTNADGIREKGGKNLTLDYITSPVWEEAFNELLSGYLQKAGFEVKMRAMDDAGIASEAAAAKYSFLYMYWTRADPSPLRILFHSSNIKGGSAYTRFSNPELDAALADGDTQTDENVRKQDYVTAQKIIMENALVLPLFTVNTVYLMLPSVQNFTFDLEGYPWIYDISLAK
ncbi:MAG: ABC transporter substrate-binding protein [Chloroflexota bacterium]